MYKSTGFISFALRRVSGVVLVFYLFTHMWVIGSVQSGAQAFNDRLALVQTPFFKMMEVLLLAAVVYHAFDGIRLLIVHSFHVTDYRKSLYYATVAVFLLVTIAGAVPMIIFALEG